MTVLLPVVTRRLCTERLQRIFPRDAFDSVMNNPLASAAVAAMIYVGAVQSPGARTEDQRFARPTTVLWLSDDVLDGYAADDHRKAWYGASIASKTRVHKVLGEWGAPTAQWYADNTRETLRDETFPKWRESGAVVDRPGLPTSSSKPRWALSSDFAALFDPRLLGDELDDAIARWGQSNLTTAGKLRAMSARRMGQAAHAVDVTLPTGERRRLEPGAASLILKGVVEEWAPRRLKSPMVLTISEPGDKIYVADQSTLRVAGISIDVSKLLPDALLADAGSEPFEFWIVEAVATDGPITEERKVALLKWAADQGIPADQCRFLTAFASRQAGPAKKRLKDLAAGTFAWYLDEPGGELAWYEIRSSPAGETPVVDFDSRRPPRP